MQRWREKKGGKGRYVKEEREERWKGDICKGGERREVEKGDM